MSLLRRPLLLAGHALSSVQTRRTAVRLAAVLAREKHTLQTFRLADIGEGITECEVIRWMVKPLASVQAFDALCEVQSDKASVEITSPYEGVVRQLLVQEGEIAKVGSGLCVIEVEEEDASDAADAEQAANPPYKPELAEKAPIVTQEPQSTTKKQHHPLDPAGSPRSPSSTSNELATPSVRHYAREKGVDLAAIGTGSGKGGRIERSDVDAFLSGGANQPQALTSTSTHTVQADHVVELGRTRMAMWKAMTQSLNIPQFGYSSKLDVTELSAILPSLNSNVPPEFTSIPPSNEPQPISPHSIYGSNAPLLTHSNPQSQFAKLTLLPLLLKTLSRAMLEWPLFRSSIVYPQSPDKPALGVRSTTDISLAMSTMTGLYTPTISDVAGLSTYAIQGELKRLQALGRQIPSGLGPREMPRKGGTVTVSNIGGIGRGADAFPLLVPGGGVAIVALGRAQWEQVYDDATGPGRRRLMLPVSWSADHRVVEGAELVAFVECWRSWAEQPNRLVGSLH